MDDTSTMAPPPRARITGIAPSDCAALERPCHRWKKMTAIASRWAQEWRSTSTPASSRAVMMASSALRCSVSFSSRCVSSNSRAFSSAIEMCCESAANSGTTTAGSPMIDFNGADNVTINGLNAGGNSLTLSNTTVSATSGTSTIRYQADATTNLLTNTSVLGSATMAPGTNGGNIWFGAAAVTTGNDNNTVSKCNIGPAGANLPTKGIYLSGSSNTDPGTANSGIVLDNNNIFDYFNATTSSAGIDLTSGSVGTTISNNRFFQSASRTMAGEPG